MVILPETSLEAAAGIAERLRHDIENRKITVTKETELRITASIGAAAIGDDETTDQLIARADEAMYTAKASGRNRVCQANPAVPS